MVGKKGGGRAAPAYLPSISGANKANSKFLATEQNLAIICPQAYSTKILIMPGLMLEKLLPRSVFLRRSALAFPMTTQLK